MEKYRIDRINEEIDGLEYISRYVSSMKQVGLCYKAKCPFHGEKTASFTVYPKGYRTNGVEQDHVSFYCFGCGKGGDIIEFKKYLMDSDSRDVAAEELEKEFGIEVDEESLNDYLKKTLKIIHKNLGHTLNFQDANLIISGTCRQYLEYIKLNLPIAYQHERKLMDYYYRYVDYIIPESNEIEATAIVFKIQEKLMNRRKKMIQKYAK